VEGYVDAEIATEAVLFFRQVFLVNGLVLGCLREIWYWRSSCWLYHCEVLHRKVVFPV